MESLTYLQQYTYKVLMCGYNVFLTGDAGTGKTHVLLKFISDSINKGYNVMVCAPTGVAASNINGVTTHRCFDIPLGLLVYNKVEYEVSDELVETDIVVMDEISMCRIDTFDFIIKKILQANNRRKRINKPCIQLVVSGDFLQLPPVMRDNEKEILDKHYKKDIGAGFAFNSPYWNMMEFKNIILTEIVRQDNVEFITNLNRIRVGDKSGLDYIYTNSSQNEINNAITLCGTNLDADNKNRSELNNLIGDSKIYRAITDGRVRESDTNFELNLELKVNSRVMLLVNKHSNNELNYTNGSFGTVLSLDDDTISVQLDNGNIEEICRCTWDIHEYTLEEDGKKTKLVKQKVGTIEQFPLKLAYAITIHKSQGQTYEYANLSPYCWDCGQLYVALSRVRKLSNLYLKYSIDPRYLVISLNVIKFYNSIVKTANQTLDLTVNKLETALNKNNEYSNNELNQILNSLSALK